MCKIITFYSFKGGVGRSFLLANVAAYLASKGRRVLCIDWDLEAPGLGDYFFNLLADSSAKAPGLTGICHELASGGTASWRDAVRKVQVGGVTLDFIPAGDERNLQARDYTNGYSQSLQRLDWDALYNERDFAGTLNQWRAEWKKDYDFVLIDSRTGLADTVGICTIHLPDELVMVFSANEQSINGGCRVLQKAVAARVDFRYSPGLPNIIPILSRLDQQAEDELSKHWLAKVRNLTAELFHSWLPHTVSLEEYYGTFKVPHFARWSFGEELPVLLPEETGADSQTISYYLHRIGDLLDGNATDNLVSLMGADEPTAASAKLMLVYFKETREYEDRVGVLRDLLRKEGVEVVTMASPHGTTTRAEVLARMAEAHAVLVLLSPSLFTAGLGWDYDPNEGFLLGVRGMRELAKVKPVGSCSILTQQRLVREGGFAAMKIQLGETELYPYVTNDNRSVLEMSQHFDTAGTAWFKAVAQWVKEKAAAAART